jgi:hypothetical protein
MDSDLFTEIEKYSDIITVYLAHPAGNGKAIIKETIKDDCNIMRQA